jgi:membrane associated rhomboid family serine protease
LTKNKQASDSLLFPFLFVGILWIVKLVEVYQNADFGVYGNLPRSISGLKGIVLSPLIHGNYRHLISNSLPLLILGIITFNFYRKIAFEIFFWVYLISGICVWIVGEDAYHIGASGLVYGFASFLFFSGMFRKEITALILSILVAIVYGGIIWGIVPGEPGVSWQTHLYGAIAGGMCAYFYRDVR